MKTVFVLALAMAAVLLGGCDSGEPDPGLAEDHRIVQTSEMQTSVVQTTTVTTTTVEQTEITTAESAKTGAVGTVTFPTRAPVDIKASTTAQTKTTGLELTEKERRDMDEADYAILLQLGDVEFMKAPLEKQKELMNEKLHEIAVNGTEKSPYPLIVKLSIVYDEAGQEYTFLYTCGVRGSVRLHPAY